MSSGGPKERFSMYVLEYLSDNCYVMFMYGSKALGVKGLGHEILMKFYQFCRLYFMLIPSFFFHRFCLVAAIIFGASQVLLWKLELIELWPLSLLWQASLWEPCCIDWG